MYTLGKEKIAVQSRNQYHAPTLPCLLQWEIWWRGVGIAGTGNFKYFSVNYSKTDTPYWSQIEGWVI